MKNIVTNWSELPVIMDTSLTALVFGVSVNTIKHWVYQGKIQSIQIGRQHFFDREYLRLLVANGREHNE